MKKYTSLLFLLLCESCLAMVHLSPPSHESFFAELHPLVTDNLDHAEPKSTPTPLETDRCESQEHEHMLTCPIFNYSPCKAHPEILVSESDSTKAQPLPTEGQSGSSCRKKRPHKSTKIHKVHLCKECNTSFESQNELKSHGLMHIKDRRRFVCPHSSCPYRTSTKQLLDNHLRKSHKILADSETIQAVRAKAAAQAAAIEPLIQARIAAQKTTRVKKRVAPDTPGDDSGRFERSCPQGCGLAFRNTKEYVEHSIRCMIPKETHLRPKDFRSSPDLSKLAKKFKDFQKIAHGSHT